MAPPRQSSPGWYPDPTDPGPIRTLRYWDGRAWTERRRPKPVLTTLELSGLAITPATQEVRSIERTVRAAELPARPPVAELPAPAPSPAPAPASSTAPLPVPTSTQEAPAGRPPGAARDKTDGPARDKTDGPDGPGPSAADHGRGEPPVPPAGGRGGGGGEPESAGTPPRSRRGMWWFLAGVAVLGALAVGLAGQALKAKPGPRVLTDQHFVQLANAECTRTMKDLRPPDSGPLGSVQTPAQTARLIDDAATGLDSLATRLAALPAAEPDRPHITAWLDGWHSFAAVGHQYADYLRRHGANQDKPPAVLQNGAQLAREADRFANSNGLKSCTFAVVPLMDPSTM